MRWLITGGSGFIGTNLAAYLKDRDNEVVVLDDLSRSGSELNSQFLIENYNLRPFRVDVSDRKQLDQFFSDERPFDSIAHLAGQVSFLASLENPRRDFEINAVGTLNILEHVRLNSKETAVIGMSSNKVYGDLTQIEVQETETRYIAPSYPIGFNESLPLEFHGPYGCSKGTADQYLSDYGRMFNLRTASLRQSSVYGPHQHPRSDQGWVAHLIEAAVANEPISLNGIGKQVRDLLYATDLARLFVQLEGSLAPGAGHQFNVGGGIHNSLSILELFAWLESKLSRPIRYTCGPMRPSDQAVFVADNSFVTEVCGWEPEVSVHDGLAAIFELVNDRQVMLN
jgi:CDP-paratose 2-epimerase